MQRNVAGQRIGAQLVSSSDGSAFTGTVTVYVTGDAGTQAIGSVGSGVCAHEGNGYHTYAPSQAETDYSVIAFTFTGTGAVPVTVQIFTAINPVTAVPTAAANASAVRTELATELARVDVATSSRLAAASYTTPPTAAANADAVWDEVMSEHTTSDTYGAHFVRSANKNQSTIQITGSQHIASDLHQCQTDVIDSDALASSAVAEIQAGLASQSSLDTKPTLAQIEASTVLAKESTVNAVGVIVTTISSNVTTLLSRITSGVAAMFLDLIQMITGTGTVNAQWTTKALENVAIPTGSGARLVSITVLLDGIAQQSALVRITKGAETYLATTNVSGLATFSANDGTWTVSITLAGATFAGATLVVDGNETVSYSMTAVPAPTPSDPDKVTGYWLCLSHLGVPESGVTVTLTAMSLPVNSTGLVLDSASRSVTSGLDGVVSFTNLIPGVRYKVVRNSGKAFYFVCPEYQADPVDLASFIGT